MQIRYDVSMLSGCNWVDVGRCADMIWWIFENGGKKYSLHTQCSARVIKESTQILTREGIYYDQDENSDNKRSSIFDFQASSVKNELLPLEVSNVQTTSLNDIIIELEGGFRIEIFADKPDGHEQWRIFCKDNSGPDLVAFTGCTEYQ